MRKSMPPLSWFRAFESAARHLSFTAAASELGLTQSAISQSVKSLEIRLGSALFVRRSRGLALTNTGRRLYPEISTAILQITNATSSLNAPFSDQVVTIAASVSFAQWYLVPNLKSFQAQNPDIQVRITTSLWPDDFIASTADIEIRFGSQKQVGEDAATALGPDQLIAVASPAVISKHAAMDEMMSWEQLRTLPFIHVHGTSNTWQYWTQYLGLSAIETFGLTVDSYGIAVDFAKAGYGVTLTSALIAMPSIKAGDIMQVYPGATPLIDQYYLAIKNKKQDAHIHTFTIWLQALIAKGNTFCDEYPTPCDIPKGHII